MALRKAENSVLWYLEELGARVVAERRTPSDRHHLGKLILRSLRDAPDFVLQIDAATDESEDFKTVLNKSIKCAIILKKFGLKTGDTIVLMAPNHIHLTIPYYAALFLGVAIAPLDATSTTVELQSMFSIIKPKAIFCQKDKEESIAEALVKEKLTSTVVCFEDTGNLVFSDLIEKESCDSDIQTFVASDCDPAETIAILLPTSGTTGLPKVTALTHKNLSISLPSTWIFCTQFPTPTRMGLVTSPLQWLTGIIHFTCAPLCRYTRVQTSQTVNANVLVPIINKYKPTYMIISPPLLATLSNPENTAKCDMTCFEAILVGGSAVSKEILKRIRSISPKAFVVGIYGMSEIGGMAFWDQSPPPGSMGRPIGNYDYRLVDPITKEDINIPHVNGELWLRGPTVCKGYYNQPEASKECFIEDGWFRTGDIFYRDENYFFYFVERFKMMLKYKNHQISPVELESVIRQHPAVLDVAVTGIPDLESGELPVACVVPRAEHHVTAQEIKDLVKITKTVRQTVDNNEATTTESDEQPPYVPTIMVSNPANELELREKKDIDSLTDTKQLRGGVVFMKELPMTASTKVHRMRLKELISAATRE